MTSVPSKTSETFLSRTPTPIVDGSALTGEAAIFSITRLRVTGFSRGGTVPGKTSGPVVGLVAVPVWPNVTVQPFSVSKSSGFEPGVTLKCTRDLGGRLEYRP